MGIWERVRKGMTAVWKKAPEKASAGEESSAEEGVGIARASGDAPGKARGRRPSPGRTDAGLRFLYLDGPARGRVPAAVIEAGDIRIGRRDPDFQPETPDLCLDFDRKVSRRHARVWREGRAWLIEDLGSANGTTLDGEPIQGRGPVRFLPGAVVGTGDSAWTMIPATDLFLQQEGLAIYARPGNINYALYQCGVPLIESLYVVNVGEEPSSPTRLTLEVEGYSDAWTVEIPPLDPGHRGVLQPKIVLHAEALRKRVEPERARLRVTVNGMPDPEAGRDLTVFGFWDWLYDPSARRTIAAFVSPRNAVITRLVHDAEAGPEASPRGGTFQDLVRKGDAPAVRQVVKTLYRYLSEKRQVEYVSPHLADGVYQSVKPPHRIFFSDRFSDRGEGTCLDLALLMAACLERVGLNPLILFTGDREDRPRHAFAGCWVSAVSGGRPLLHDRATLLREVEADPPNLLLVECNGFADGAFASGKKTFPEAAAAAVEELRASPWVCAVDVGALRATIKPVESPVEPEVARAYDEAERFAVRKGYGAVETQFLLYGLLATGGEVTRWLCEKAGLDIREKLAAFDWSVSSQGQAFTGQFTGSCQHCRSEAERLAKGGDYPSVREQDLWWALLGQRTSSSLQAAYRTLGVEPVRLQDLMAKQFPHSKSPTSL